MGAQRRKPESRLIASPQQVVSCGCKREDPSHMVKPRCFNLRRRDDIFHPAEDSSMRFLSFWLIREPPCRVVASRWRCRQVAISSDATWGYVHMTAFGDELRGVKALITATAKRWRPAAAPGISKRSRARATVALQQTPRSQSDVAILITDCRCNSTSSLLASTCAQFRPIGGGSGVWGKRCP